MAVSQMQACPCILSKRQRWRSKNQIYDLSEQEEHEPNSILSRRQRGNRQALVELQKRQEQVEKMIQTLNYMPEKKACKL